MTRLVLGGLVALTLAFNQATPPAAQTGSPSFPPLVGSVTAGNGADARPVRHARVTLQRTGGAEVRVSDTDAKGAYRFDGIAPAGELRVMVDKAGFVKTEWTVGSERCPRHRADDGVAGPCRRSGIRARAAAAS